MEVKTMALNNFNFNNSLKSLIDDVIKTVGPVFYKNGVNDLADMIQKPASDLLKKGSSEGGQIMNAIKKARKL